MRKLQSGYQLIRATIKESIGCWGVTKYSNLITQLHHKQHEDGFRSNERPAIKEDN